MGCDECVNTTKYGCTECSEGFFYYNSSCGGGCPPSMYANPNTRTCEECQPPCLTCSQLNNQSCTNCPSGYLLFNGTCITYCPVTHYEGLLGEYPIVQVPACISKILLNFTLRLTTEARVIYIDFSQSIIATILAISQRINIQIENSMVASEFYMISPVTASTIKFKYLGD